MSTTNREHRARTMVELKAAIYEAHGWQRKRGESMGARCKKLYDFSVDHEAGLFVAKARTPAGETK